MRCGDLKDRPFFLSVLFYSAVGISEYTLLRNCHYTHFAEQQRNRVKGLLRHPV